jgi:hypothetical protein
MNYTEEEVFEKRNDRAREIGSIIAQVEILAIKVEVRDVTFCDREDIVRELKKISERLDKIEL